MIDTAPLRRKLLDLAITGKLVPKQGEWRTVKLVDIFRFIDYRGKTPKKIASGIPLITARNVRSGYIDYTNKDFISVDEFKTRQSRGISHAGDLLFTTEAPLGCVAIADLDVFSAGQRIITLQQYDNDSNEVDNVCMMYFMLSRKWQDYLFSKKTGSMVSGIKAETLKQLTIPLPPIAEQKAIVKRLEELLKLEGEIAAESAALDDLITAAKRKILSLAISGRLVPRQGEWKSVKLGEMCEVINGLWKGVKKPFVNVGVIRAANFTKDCKLNLEKTVYIDVEAGKYETRKLQEDDLIVERSGGGPGQPVGRVVLFPKVDGEYSISNFTSILRITDWRTANPKYLHMALVSIYNTGYTEKIQTQTTNLHNLNFKEYLNIPIPLPSLAEQKAIVARVEELQNVVDALKE